MVYQQAISSKYSIATACVAVVLASFFFGRFSIGSSGAAIGSTPRTSMMDSLSASDDPRNVNNDRNAPVHFVSMAQDREPTTTGAPAVAASSSQSPSFHQAPFAQPLGTVQSSPHSGVAGTFPSGTQQFAESAIALPQLPPLPSQPELAPANVVFP